MTLKEAELGLNTLGTGKLAVKALHVVFLQIPTRRALEPLPPMVGGSVLGCTSV